MSSIKSEHYDAENGKSVYVKNCQVCHQPDGRGVPKMFPPLKENPRMRDDSKVLVGIVLNGLSGEIVVNGEVYNNIMAPYKGLSDKEIADVLNYVRYDLNHYSMDAVLPETVADMRRRVN